jgi:LysM domain
LAPAGYSLHVPKGSGSYLMAALQMVPAERRTSWRMHTVENGETLATIGKRYRTAPATIAAVNKIQSVSPAVGDRLLIPAAYHEPSPARVATAKRSHARRFTGGSQRASVQRRRPSAKGHVKRAAAFHQSPGKLARAGAQ